MSYTPLYLGLYTTPIRNRPTLLENLTDDTFAQLYATRFSTISLYLTKLYVTQSFAISSSVTYSKICQTFLTVQTVYFENFLNFSNPPFPYITDGSDEETEGQSHYEPVMHRPSLAELTAGLFPNGHELDLSRSRYRNRLDFILLLQIFNKSLFS